jgi:hypothetical protein
LILYAIIKNKDVINKDLINESLTNEGKGFYQKEKTNQAGGFMPT